MGIKIGHMKKNHRKKEVGRINIPTAAMESMKTNDGCSCYR
jgi:hypothetical protein